MNLKSKKRIFALIIIILIALASALFVLADRNSSSSIFGGGYGPKPESNVVDSFYANEILYDCSSPISGQWTKGSAGPQASPTWEFRPDSFEEAEKYCRAGAVIEYKSVLDILKREDVKQVIDRYASYEASVKALSHTYIDDKEYLSRILPNYESKFIDCIIVVHSPEETRFFVEYAETHGSHADHEYIEVPSEEFLTSLNSAPDSDVTAFWLGLH